MPRCKKNDIENMFVETTTHNPSDQAASVKQEPGLALRWIRNISRISSSQAYLQTLSSQGRCQKHPWGADQEIILSFLAAWLSCQKIFAQKCASSREKMPIFRRKGFEIEISYRNSKKLLENWITCNILQI